MLQGYEDRVRGEQRGRAWMVSHQLIAAGCDASKVTPAKLLGEKERRRKVKPAAAQLPIDEIFRRMKGAGGDGTTQ